MLYIYTDMQQCNHIRALSQQAASKWRLRHAQCNSAKRGRGFTIVELLIVIVVIGILAAITIVAYNGTQQRARAATVVSDLANASQQLKLDQVDTGSFPATIDAANGGSGLKASSGTTYQYSVDNSATPQTFCLTATNGTISYKVSQNSAPAEGVCAGYNLVAWNKTEVGATPPVPAATVDTAVFRISTASMRIGPGMLGQQLRNNPYGGTPGQMYTVSFWIRTDSVWNGTGNNSKIRFAIPSNGGLLAACAYAGVKTSWELVTCSYTLTSSAPQVAISVGNDGSIGNIWLDDMSLTLN